MQLTAETEPLDLVVDLELVQLVVSLRTLTLSEFSPPVLDLEESVPLSLSKEPMLSPNLVFPAHACEANVCAPV